MKATAQIRDSPNSSGDNPAYLLCRGIKSILRCDEAEVVSGIARYVVAQRPGLRLLSILIERTSRTPFPTAVALYGGLRSFLAVRQGNQSVGAVWIARFGNERQAIRATIEKSVEQLPASGWTELKFHWRPDRHALAALARNVVVSLRRLPRFTRLLRRRYEFFKVLRVIELIAFYNRYLSIFQNGRFSLAVTSNHSNPHGFAFNLAARKCGVPVVLITHGMPIRPVAKLFYDLAVVHCEAAQQTYFEEGCRMGRVLVHSRRSQHRPMPDGPLPERLTVGVFLCKDVNEERLCGLLERFLDHPRVSRILVRPHPTNLWEGLDAWIAERNDSRVSRSFDRPVPRDLDECDIVLAGNSSVLVEAVNAGCPAGYVAGLDYGSTDLHSFVTKGLIYPIDEELNFDPEAVLSFYQRPDWSAALRLFANIDEDEALVSAQLGAALRDLAAPRH